MVLRRVVTRAAALTVFLLTMGNEGCGQSSPTICEEPLQLVDSYNGRGIYVLAFDLDLSPDACALKKTDRLGGPNDHGTIGFLAGSPGYSLNPRGDLLVIATDKGTVNPDGVSVDLLEGDYVTVTLGKRPGAPLNLPPDAGPPPTPAGPWKLTFTLDMASPPEDSKVRLHGFDW